MRVITDKDAMTEYVKDESACTGEADMICFPETEEEIMSVLQSDLSVPVTIQGSRTGLTGGCVPDRERRGIVLCMERMNRIIGEVTKDQKTKGGFILKVEPGLKLCRLREYLQARGLFFPPDPTEPTATIGGMVNCNSSGSRSYRYGSIRPFVAGLELVLPTGEKLDLQRGRDRCRGRHFHAVTSDGRILEGELPVISIPQVRKFTAGYYIRPDMDLLDLVIGAEGTLGVITSVTLKILPARKRVWGSIQFFEEEKQALRFVQSLRESGICLEALEFFGEDCLELIRSEQKAGRMLTDLPALKADMRCGVYTETEDAEVRSLTERYRAIGHFAKESGGDPRSSWAAVGEPDMDGLKRLRHSAPAAVNHVIRQRKQMYPDITKLGTDMSIPPECLPEVFYMYRHDLQEMGFRSSIFGHIGDGHLHVNILPDDMEEHRRGRVLYRKWAQTIVCIGGSVSAEHGIGKLKKWLLKEQYMPKEITQMKALRKVFDPMLRCNTGNLF